MINDSIDLISTAWGVFFTLPVILQAVFVWVGAILSATFFITRLLKRP